MLMQGIFTVINNELSIAVCARCRESAIRALRPFGPSHGLASHAIEHTDDFPGRATGIELTFNLESAGALPLAVPPPVLARADEVIE